MMRRLIVVLLGLALGAGLALVLQPGDAASPRAASERTSDVTRTSTRARTPYVPKIKHVFVINIENKGYDQTWGPKSQAL